MYIRPLSNGRIRVHLHVEDDYELTLRGLDVDFTQEQLRRFARFAAEAFPEGSRAVES